MNNNFRTNFDPMQVADVLFRYALTSYPGEWQAAPACTFGWQAATPLETVCIKGPQAGRLAVQETFCELDRDDLILLTLKMAEDGDGIILRLFETEGQACQATLHLPHFIIQKAFLTNLVEENLGELALDPGLLDSQRIRLAVRANSLTTVRLQGAWQTTPHNCDLARY